MKSGRKTCFYDEKENVHHAMLSLREENCFANVYISTLFPVQICDIGSHEMSWINSTVKKICNNYQRKSISIKISLSLINKDGKKIALLIVFFRG